MKVQDMVDGGLLSPDSIPAGILSPTPLMKEFVISVEGILKLLKNLKPGKAAGPGKLKPLLLQELREEIAPILQKIFERALQTDNLPADWCRAVVTPVFKEGILKLLKNLKPGKAAGPDKLKPLLLQELREEIAPILQIIFERALQTGNLPADWCRALVSPVFKKGEKSSAANYSPISLTCILCKVLDHIMASHLAEQLNTHDLLYDLHYSFGNFISTESEDMHLVGSVPSWVTGLSQWFWMVRNQTRFQSHQESLRALCWTRFCSSSIIMIFLT